MRERIAKISRKIPSTVYIKCKNLYRVPPDTLKKILDGLKDLQWTVCSCPYQADTHIADLCRKDPNKDVVILTKDSDLLVYEDVHSITMPRGRSYELTTFKKADVLESMDLPSARHLLLAAILSTNDYSRSIPWYGLSKNTDIVRGIKIDYEPDSSDPHRVQVIKDAIQAYLARVERPHTKTLLDYNDAITAFVECKEDFSSSAVSSTSTHDQICDMLRKLELLKLSRKASSSSPNQSSSIPRQQPLQGKQQHKEQGGKEVKAEVGRKKRKRKRKRQRISVWISSR